eukprot:CAMPEP_0171675158 /NCGR_PEP_ID=MMETSP0990-20121206/53657_1 /TAXON_ID=483369 /ORGANISM="non described non described, Strain CCMP2098" /LENGTH=49 /DNA_ID= /DNA_START= /DNA_END= /DNA_ORIENTATION=
MCGSENPDPLVVSRAQFVAVAANALDELREGGTSQGGGGMSLGQQLYSC